MKAREIIRINIFLLIGAVLMFYLQPWLYNSKVIILTDVLTQNWLYQNYFPGSVIVYTTSLISTVLWLIMAVRAKVIRSVDAYQWQVVWWVVGLLPILSICVAIYFFKDSKDALLSLTSLYIMDILLLFWLPTATSTPGLLKYVPPGSFFLRRIIGFY